MSTQQPFIFRCESPSDSITLGSTDTVKTAPSVNVYDPADPDTMSEIWYLKEAFKSSVYHDAYQYLLDTMKCNAFENLILVERHVLQELYSQGFRAATNGKEIVLDTDLVSAKDLKHLEMLRKCMTPPGPMGFQRLPSSGKQINLAKRT